MPTADPVYILIVNDREEDLSALEAALGPTREIVVRALTSEEGLRLAHEREFAVAILDIVMPDVDGFELAARLRAHRSDLPIIFVSALDPTPELIERIYGLGAVDFLSTPIPANPLRAKVAVFIDLYRKRKALERAARDLERRAEAALNEQQERFRLFMEAASDYAVFFIDPDGRISEWTTGAQHVFGWTAEQAEGQLASLIFIEEDQRHGASEREMARAREDGQATDERWHRRADGSRFFAVGRLVALRNDSGALVGYAKILRDATTQKMSEERLRESVVRFTTLADNIAQLAWMTDRAGNVFWYNRRWFDYTGTTLEQVAGWGWQSVHHPEHVERVTRKLEQAFETGSAWEDVFPLRARDGTYRWFLSQAVPVRDEGGAISGWFGTNTDVHETFVAQDALRASEEQFRVFFESSAAGHVAIDPQTRRFVRVNARFCEITGYSPAELEQMTFTDLTHPDDRPFDHDAVTRLYGGAKDVSVEKRYVRKDGGIIWVHITATLVRTTEGRPRLQISVVQDITSRKAAERALLESRTQLGLAIDAAELGTFFHNEATGQTHWNEHMKRMLGLPRTAIESPETFFQCVHPDDRARLQEEWVFAREAGGRDFYRRIEFRVGWPDGSVRHLSAVARNVVETLPAGTNVVRIVGAIRDVTEARKFEQALQDKVAERTAALEEKTAQLESFCYTVAHDLRSPLRAISGYADFVFQDYGQQLPPEGQEYLGKIKSSASRLDLLIKDLLAYSRIAQVDVAFDDVPLQSSVDWARQQLQADIERNGARLEIAAPLPAVRAERSVLDQVMLNLLSNAIKFARAGTPPVVRVAAETHDSMVRLTVQDNGIGIAPAHHERIFKVFERLKEARDYPGTGVGLAIVAKAVERLGGRVGLESEPGRGSTFWIELRKAES